MIDEVGWGIAVALCVFLIACHTSERFSRFVRDNWLAFLWIAIRLSTLVALAGFLVWEIVLFLRWW